MARSEQSLLQLDFARRTSTDGDLARQEEYHLDHDGLSFASLDSFKPKQPVETNMSRPALSTLAATQDKARRTEHVRNPSITTTSLENVNGEPITFITVQDPWFEKNLGSSPIWLQREQKIHEWIVLNNSENKGITLLYAEAQTRAANDLIVFLHPDVFLPETFYDQFMSKLALIEKLDPNWGVLGTAGVFRWWHPPMDWGEKTLTSIHTLDLVYQTGVDSAPVQTLDESFLVVRKKSLLTFDTALPGFDLYGSDMCLTARQAGRDSYLLNVLVKHKTLDPAGLPFTMAVFNAKIQEPAYLERLEVTRGYLLNKWCSSDLLPVYGTAFDLVCP